MNNYMYHIRIKSQFESHTHEPLKKKVYVETIEYFQCKEDNEIGTFYADSHLPERPAQSHTLFIAKCNFYVDGQKEQFEEFLKQGIAFDLIYQVSIFEIVKKEKLA